MKFPRLHVSTIDAFQMYHGLTYFTSGDIRKLFRCSPCTATKIKKMALYEMDAQGIKIYCEQNGLVDKDVLFEIAGLDIKKINKSYKMLQSAKIV